MPNGTRRAYTSAGAFLSYGFNSWSQVVAASAEDLALPQGTFIPPQDGSIICSDRNDSFAVKGTCYEVSGGQKFGFTSAAVFTGLGFSFTNSSIADVSWMTAGSQLLNSTTAAHLPGTLVNNNGTVQLMGNSGLLGIPDVATFNSWGYSFTKVAPANAADKAMTQSGVMATRVAGQLSPTALVNTGCTSNCGTPVVNGTVTASLASDTPAAGTLVSSTVKVGSIYPGQVSADIAHFTFTGSGTVTQIVVNRIGVSADTSVNNVYLYMGNNRITDAGSFSNGVVTFSNASGLFTVSGSTEVGIRIDVAGNISGQTIGAQLASFSVANGSPMATSISGNLFTTASVSTLATANVTGAGSNPPVTGKNDVTAGITNYPVWSYNISIGQRAVALKYIQFKQIGSISPSAIQNLHLYIDGASVGPVSSITNSGSNTNVVIFDLSGSPVTLTTGGHLVELHGDVVTGTSYTFDFSLQNSADVVLVDPNYNVNIQLTNNNAQLVQLSPGVSGISSGTVSVQQDPAFTTTQFVSNSSGVVLGSWTMKAYGENVKVQSLNATINVSGGYIATNEGFNNLAVYVNGGQVGSSQSALITSGTSTQLGLFSFGGSNLFTIPAGTTVTVQVKGDSVYTNSTFTSEVVTLATPANSLQGVTSFALTPSSNTNYNGVSLSTSANSSLGTLVKNSAYTPGAVGSNTTGVEIGSYTIQASNADGIRVNSVVTGLVAGSSTFNLGTTTGQTVANMVNALANIKVVVTYPGGSVTGVPQQPASTNTFSLSGVTIPANQTATVNVFADVSNATGTIVTNLYANAQGQTSNQTLSGTGFASGSAQTGQTVTIGNGTIAQPTRQTSSPVASFVIGGATAQPSATFNFVASSGGATIQELDFDTTDASGSPLVAITGVTVGSVTAPMVGASSTVTGLNISVPVTYGGVDVPVTVSYANVGSGGIASNVQFRLNLIRVKYLSGSTTSYLPAGGTSYLAQASSNYFDLVGSYPTVSLVTATNRLSASTINLGQITVSANAAGNVILEHLPLSLSAYNASITAATVYAVDASTGVTAASSTAVVTVNGTSGAQTPTLDFTLSNGYGVDNNIAAGTSKTYNIQVAVTTVGSSTNGNPSVSMALGQASSFTFKDVNGNGDGILGLANSNTYLTNYPTNSVSVAP
jgi:hypothetical protein